MGSLEITAVRTFLTQPGRCPLIVVKVLTNEPGLYGLGCATFSWRHRAVVAAIEHHLGPFVTGEDPGRVQDLWYAATFSGYWRGGPVLSNAVSGIDMALWDIKGKLAGMPCCDLWGGRCRPAAAVYGHANGRDPAEVADRARELIERGYRFVRCQLGGYSSLGDPRAGEPGLWTHGRRFDPREKVLRVPRLFEFLRSELGEEVELLHDAHSRLHPPDALILAKALEPYRLFFLEDIVAPEDAGWLRRVRDRCATPLAIGELFTSAAAVAPLAAERLFDFLRVHVSFVGGITPALKLAAVCEAFGIRTAWHGPGDLSPVGAAANAHLGLAVRNFGVQEWASRSDAEEAVFPGAPQVRDGFVRPADGPGLGIDFDEREAARHPVSDAPVAWTTVRLPDGSIHPP